MLLTCASSTNDVLYDSIKKPLLVICNYPSQIDKNWDLTEEAKAIRVGTNSVSITFNRIIIATLEKLH